MKQILESVEEFHRAFEVPVRDTPALISDSEWQLRHEIMREESQEYADACQKGDLVAVADALGDQLYVLCGTILAHGMQSIIEDVLQEIHRSNMSKLDEQGLPVRRDDGKVMKSSLYSPPDLRRFIAD